MMSPQNSGSLLRNRVVRSACPLQMYRYCYKHRFMLSDKQVSHPCCDQSHLIVCPLVHVVTISSSSLRSLFSRQSIPLVGCTCTPLSSAYLLCLRTVGPVGWHHFARCPSWGLHAVGSPGVHGSLSSALCCKSVGQCRLFGTCGIGGATSCEI
jgi:hypothetical protein